MGSTHPGRGNGNRKSNSRSVNNHHAMKAYLDQVVAVRHPHSTAVLLPDALLACPPEGAIILPLTECSGPWLETSQYWERIPESKAPAHLRNSVCGTLLHCRYVWWMQFWGVQRNVPPGTYACVFRLNIDPGNSFEAEFKVGPEDAVGINMDFPYKPDTAIPELKRDRAFFTTRCQNGPAVMRAIRDKQGWSQLVIGVIEVRQECDIHCAVGGNNKYGTGGLWFDALQLVPLGAPWAVARLLWLASKKNDPRDCELAALDEHALRRIQQMLQPRVIIDKGTWSVGST